MVTPAYPVGVGEEMLFSVIGSSAHAAEPISLVEAGLKERADLQEWVLEHPAILGADVMVVTFEFDRWQASAGAAPQDRLDVLGLGEDGRLVVAELKRDRAPDTTEMEAIKYAAMASRFTVDTLTQQHARFREQRGQGSGIEDALAALAEHAPELSEERLRRPRIVLLARDFPPTVTASVVWLTEMGIDITLQRFQAYRSTVPGAEGAAHTQVLVTVSQLYPVRDVEEFTVSPAQAQARAATETKKRTQDVSTVRRLVDAEAVEDGTQFTLVVRSEINADLRAQVEQWLEEDTERRTATWQNNARAPLRWTADGTEHTPSGLVRLIVREATGIDRSFYGTQWWVDPQGHTLVELAGELGGGGRSELYRAFWTRFLERAATERPEWAPSKVPPATSWLDMTSGIKGTHFSNSFAVGDRLRTELYIDTPNQSANLAIFHKFQDHKAQIEAAYGGHIDWLDLPSKTACRIAAYRGDAVVTRVDDYDKYIDWMFGAGARLRSALLNAWSTIGKTG